MPRWPEKEPNKKEVTPDSLGVRCLYSVGLSSARTPAFHLLTPWGMGVGNSTKIAAVQTAMAELR